MKDYYGRSFVGEIIREKISETTSDLIRVPKTITSIVDLLRRSKLVIEVTETYTTLV